MKSTLSDKLFTHFRRYPLSTKNIAVLWLKENQYHTHALHMGAIFCTQSEIIDIGARLADHCLEVSFAELCQSYPNLIPTLLSYGIPEALIETAKALLIGEPVHFAAFFHNFDIKNSLQMLGYKIDTPNSEGTLPEAYAAATATFFPNTSKNRNCIIA